MKTSAKHFGLAVGL